MQTQSETYDRAEQAVRKLLRYCRSELWLGYDPYDGLNSPVARWMPIKNRFTRTALTQLVKRSPVNLRPLLGIRKSLNPKGLALAARSIIRLAMRQGDALPVDLYGEPDRTSMKLDNTADSFETDLRFMLNKLDELRSGDYAEACWGYNFDWQSRAFFAPRGTPNAVCTVFAAHAFMDWYEQSGSARALEIAESSCRFLLDRLNRMPDADGFCFSYTPQDQSRVHNVNLLAAELLARAYRHTRATEYGEAAERATRFTLARQREDGAWPYGEAPSQTWIDSFHTGFIIVSLKRLIQYLSKDEWQSALQSAYQFYEKRFFLADGTPGYYHDKLYPIDIHSAAQAVITFSEMTELTPHSAMMADRAVEWAINRMQDRAGFFYSQRRRFYTVKIPYMRWAQAWSLYALSLYLTRDATNNV